MSGWHDSFYNNGTVFTSTQEFTKVSFVWDQCLSGQAGECYLVFTDWDTHWSVTISDSLLCKRTGGLKAKPAFGKHWLSFCFWLSSSTFCIFFIVFLKKQTNLCFHVLSSLSQLLFCVPLWSLLLCISATWCYLSDCFSWLF